MKNPHTRRDVLVGAAAFSAVLSTPTSAAPVTHDIEIKKLRFEPKTVSVKIGDTIRWVNLDIAPHTATANDGTWDSDRLKKNDTFELTVTEGMETEYFCIYHPHMQAVIEITKSLVSVEALF